jgi:site-specific DNA-methyltransferase (adenine-specific)
MSLDHAQAVAGTGAIAAGPANATLHAGDCLAVLAGMPAASFDVVVTSPPYNIGVNYSRHHDRLPRQTYLSWMADVARALRRVLAPGASVFLNVGSTNADPWIVHDVGAAFRDSFVLQNSIVWVKSVAIGDETVGHFKPITSGRYLNNNHETIFHFTLDGSRPIDRLGIGVPFKDKSNIARWGHAQDRRCAGNVWLIPYQTVRSRTQKFDHPAGFPEELPRRCLLLHGDPRARVLDPFMGTGTTLVAARRLGMPSCGIDIDSAYVETARRRLTEVS